MSGVAYGTNNNTEVVTRGSHRVSCRILRVPDKHGESPYPVGADSLDQHNSVYDGTIVAIHRGEDTNVVRGLIPVVGDLAGHSAGANSFDEIDMDIQPIGIVMNDAISNATTADNMATAVVRGQTMCLNTGPKTIQAGQKFRAVIPKAESIAAFRNNPQHPSIRPLDKMSSKLGLPRGKVNIQTVPVDEDDHMSIEDIDEAGPSSSRAVQTFAMALQLNNEAAISAALLAAESEGIITINAPGADRVNAKAAFTNAYGNISAGGNSAWVTHVKKVRTGVRMSQGPFAMANGNSLVKQATEVTMARRRHALLMGKRRFGKGEGRRRDVHKKQVSTAKAIVSAFTQAVRQHDQGIVGMALQSGKPGDKFEVSVDFTR